MANKYWYFIYVFVKLYRIALLDVVWSIKND